MICHNNGIPIDFKCIDSTHHQGVLQVPLVVLIPQTENHGLNQCL